MNRLAACLLFLSSSALAAEPDRQGVEFFEKKVRPLLVERCYKCHSRSSKKQRGGLLVDSRSSLLEGGDSGPAVVLDKPESSLLLRAVRHTDDRAKMPPKKKLSYGEIRLLEEWVRRGLPFPESAEARTIDFDRAREFWSFRPLGAVSLPRVARGDWASRRLDRFVLAKLEQHRLSPAPEADRRTLIRRLYFDVVGLPPTPEDVAEFVDDTSAEAYPRLVDRLLASPHHGERWGRHWLDLTRYCDVAEAWANVQGKPYFYRDWVVRALNEDRPFDDFVRAQLAADQWAGASEQDRPALGFLGLSPLYWKEPKLAPAVIETIVAEEWEERIEAVSRTFLGLTVGCARCHDHKFDPITSADYYALAGVFASTRQVDKFLLSEDRAKVVRDAKSREKTLQGEFDKAKKKGDKEAVARLQDQLAKVRGTPGFDAPKLRIVEDAALHVLPDGEHRTKLEYKVGEARDVALQKRGNPSKPGEVVPRRFLELLDPKGRRFTHGSGRLDLAEAIVGVGGPLTSRVVVNRVWKHHFGAGLVETPSDFGSQGERPSHPGLLDDLARRFVDNEWSLKWLHREILLSSTYRQASTTTAGNRERALPVDPENRLLWRAPRRRLDIEAWRDSMLAVSGTLDAKSGGAPLDLANLANNRRTIYGTVKRRELSAILRLHDFPDPTSHSAKRIATTTALQQLFVLNSPFVESRAKALASRIRREDAGEVGERIRRLYALLYGRQPTSEELELGRAFLEDESESAWVGYCKVLLGGNEFLFVD